MSPSLRRGEPMVTRFCSTVVVAMLLEPCAAYGHEPPAICDIVEHPERFAGRSVEVDAIFSSDAIHQSYLLASNCSHRATVDIHRDQSGSGGKPSLFWELVRAYRQSTPTNWYGVSARARVRVHLTQGAGQRAAVTVEDISEPRMVPIAAPPRPPARQNRR